MERADSAFAQNVSPQSGLKSRFSSSLGKKKNQTVGKTIVSVEILADSSGVILQLNQWRSVFQKLGVSVRVRQNVLSEQPETRERKQGRLRLVTVRGRLDRSGKLIFADNSFSLGEGGKLKEWINELKSYGAEGSPDGKPIWGLSKSAFVALHKSLGEPVKLETADLPLETAVDTLQLPNQLPVRFSLDSRKKLRENSSPVPTGRQEVQGMSKGTALAILLKAHGFGFRPLRTPTGSIELVVEPLSKTTDVWPVGWSLPDTLPRFKAFPTLFKIAPIEFKDVKLSRVFDSISAKTHVPILVDHYALKQKGIDVNSIVVSSPYRKTSWGVVLRNITGSKRIKRRYRLDEQGLPFVWITTLEPGSPRK